MNSTMDQQLNTTNTLEAIDVLKRNQSSLRERVLARKKGLVDPINTDLDTNVQTQEVVTPSASPSKRPLISPRANFNNINNNNNNNNNNNISEKKQAAEESDQPARKHYRISTEDDIEKLLNQPSIKERERNKVGNELVELLERQSVKEKSLIEKFKTKGGPKVTEYCSYGTREDCIRERQKNSIPHCDKIHFRRIIKGHTDIALGDCSYLDTCRHMKTCKFVHYEIDDSVDTISGPTNINNLNTLNTSQLIDSNSVSNLEPQWICCDIRRIDMNLLGQFSVIMADPPWDIHMELPYGTLNDDEMRSLNVGPLQKNGWFFLWVTGRAMELGRECLQLWGYERVEEVIWVKTNQLQRIIRTGRTGHWLNHSKEHCLVGVKGNPGGNRFLDSDVIVAEVRETSRKPDEIYQIIERLSPATRKLELFGRPHNSQPGWLTVGNQLEGVRLHDPQMRDKITKHLADIQ